MTHGDTLALPCYSSGIAAGANQRFQISGVAASSTAYTIALDPMTADFDLDVFWDNTFSAAVCSSSHAGTTRDACTTTAQTTSLYIQATAFVSGGATVADTYSLRISP
jgi:hypothetical protein